MTELPASFYAIIGILVVTNMATLFTLLTVIFKAGFFVAETKTGIKDAKDAAVRAHKRIDKIEGFHSQKEAEA